MVAGVGDTPPLPTLMEERFAEARAREKQIPTFRLGWGKPPPLPPPPIALPQNPWHTATGTFPAHSTKVRTYKPVIYVPNEIIVGRSRFRKGVVSFDANGLAFSGVAVKPVNWLNQLGCAAYIVLGLLLVLQSVPSLRGYVWDNSLRWVGGTALVVACLSHVLQNVITEWQHEPQNLFVPWGDCLEGQWERGLGWAVIVYRSYEADPEHSGKGVIAHLPLNDLSPAQAAALWDAFDEHAPGRNRVADEITETDPRFWLVVSLLIGIVCFSLTVLLWRRTNP